MGNLKRRQATLVIETDEDSYHYGKHVWNIPKAYGKGHIAQGVGGAMLDNNHMLDLKTGQIITKISKRKILRR